MNRRILLPMVLAAMMVAPAMAQDKPAEEKKSTESTDRRDRGGDNNDRGGRGNYDPAQARERMTNWMKEQLGGLSDDEWKVIQPKVEKVMTARRDAGGGMSFFGGRSRGGDEQEKTAVQKASAELKTVIDDKNSSPDQIKAKLTALREAKEKAKGELVTAQKDLKDVLTQRQEATMVMLGMLD